MDKKQLHHLWTFLRPVRPSYLLVACAVSSVVCVVSLRSNNSHMVELRDAVYAADRADGDVTAALQDLRLYVSSHMNTDLASGANAVYPPVQLKFTYDRLVKAESDRATKENSRIYTAAQRYCEAKIPTGFSGRYRIDCIQGYVKDHGVKPHVIPDSLYKFAFVSPRWSPDLAGWSMLVAIVSFLGFLITWSAKKWLKHQVR